MQWVAYYNDGTHLCQYDDDGTENKYADIDRSKLDSFALYDRPATRKLFHLHIEPGQRLIYRRRVEKIVGGPEQVCYMIGWQQTVGEQNIQSIAYVFEDGTIELAGRWRDDHSWFYSIQTVPSEEGPC